MHYRCRVRLSGVLVSGIAWKREGSSLVEVHVYRSDMPFILYQKMVEDSPLKAPFNELVFWLEPHDVFAAEGEINNLTNS